ncbi:MAG: hypothetical protein AAFX04_03195 [Pseudomonadota bacterium]
MQRQEELVHYASDAAWRRALGDKARQHMQAWRTHPALTPWLELLDETGAAARTDNGYSALCRAAPIVEDRALARAFLIHWTAAIRDDPLMVPALSVHMGAQGTSAMLYRKGSLTLSLLSLPGQKHGDATAPISFAPGASAFAPVNDAATMIQSWRETSASEGLCAVPEGEPIALGDRARVIDTDRCSVQLHPTDKTQLLLRLTWVPQGSNGLRQRHYAASDGRPLGTTSADSQTTRQMLALSALRALQAKYAMPAMLAMTGQPLAPLRWQALRECAATDVMAVLPRAKQMAHHDPDTRIRAMAGALVQQMAECTSSADNAAADAA